MLTDTISERHVLAIVLNTGDASILNIIPRDAWTDESCKLFATIIRDRHARGIPIDPQTIGADAVKRAGTDHEAHRLSNQVLDMIRHSPPAVSLSYYAERIISIATIRRLAAQATRFGQHLEGMDPDDEDTFSKAVATMREQCDDAAVGFKQAACEPPMSVGELIDGPDLEFDWLVPGLLEATDRMMLVAPEGVGKTQLLAQMAACVAAGLHPFTGWPLPIRHGGYRVLVVDCENSVDQLRRRFRALCGQVGKLADEAGISVDWYTQMRMVTRPEGVSLTDPRELARMEQAVESTNPDLLVIGPLYRLSQVDVKDDMAAKALTDCIDMLRVRHHLAVIAETHAGHAQNGASQRQLRPFGSSLFLRWPEFGLALRPHTDHSDEEHPSLMNVVKWRGSRDNRDWPHQIQHGKRLPWEPADLSYYDFPNRGARP